MRCIGPLLLLSLASNLTACGGATDAASAAAPTQTSSGSDAGEPAPASGSTSSGASSGATAPVSSSTSPPSGPSPAVGVPGAGIGGSGAVAVTRSIKEWTACDGQTDDAVGAAAAFDAARHAAFTLIVDCPVRLHIASDIARPIFIDDDTAAQFTGAGTFIVDNVLQPAFVIAGSQNVTLTDWNVEYVGGVPVDPDVGGYVQNGRFMKLAGSAQPAMAFNNLRLTPWLAANRGMTFASGVTSLWAGPSNTSSVFYVIGDVTNLQVTGMRLYVPAGVGGERFIPMAFSLTRNFKANQAVTAMTGATAQAMAVPHNLAFSNIELDGTYMGWQGSAQAATFSNIQSHRYGDLQDAAGGNVGGIGKWFAPPHLFYLNYASDGDPGLFNRNITIGNVVDDGPRVGVARDRGGSDTVSGSALSLKLGCVSCSVDGYATTRPDGFLDLLDSSGLAISNATATYDSSFLNNVYPGWRFPDATGSTNVTVRNTTLTDVASESLQPPIANASQAGNQNISLQNVVVNVNRWAGAGSIYPGIQGQGNSVTLEYMFKSTQSRVMYVAQDSARLTLQSQPDALSTAQTAVLTWTSEAASSCMASGAWVGTLGSKGSRTYKASSGGSVSFSIGCQAGGKAVTATLPVTVTASP
jgi:hypothetical protein